MLDILDTIKDNPIIVPFIAFVIFCFVKGGSSNKNQSQPPQPPVNQPPQPPNDNNGGVL